MVIPIYKGGDKCSTTNYRPITLKNSLAKIFEKCLKWRLVDYLEKHKIISDKQFGFRRGLSTEHAVVDLIENIVHGINNNQKCLTVFLDLAKAFDTVDHNILLNIMEDMGIRGIVRELFWIICQIYGIRLK